VHQWGEEKQVVYQSGVKHGLITMLHEVAEIVEPNRALEISEVDYDE